MSDNIKVVVKVRPLIPREVDDKLFHQWKINNNTLYQIDTNGKDVGPSFTFDKVYDTTTKTEDVYNDIAKPIVEAATRGFNGTIFAYGQTSSGKTFTMTGTDEAPGIIPLAVLNLFNIIKTIPNRDFLVRVSYVEIYNESLIDLLDIKKQVKIQETHNGVKVCTTEKPTVSPDEVLELMRQGKANRQTGSTNMNEESSRSHSIFQITIESREHNEGQEEVGLVNVSQLNLVDLAGSERAGQTGATGIRFKEGTHINKSLSVLGLVIKQLSEGLNKHVSYRDSKLTRILQNSLGGNAKTSIICAVTPAAVEETISTLQFANRAKTIKNTPAINPVATSATMIQSLTKQLCSLKTQLESKKNIEKDNHNLQKQIAKLQRLILNGFVQNHNTDMISSARRKLHQPRRVTISTLLPIQEDPSPNIPKFCTPSLKYNPLSLNTRESSIPSGSFLTPVCEERAVTPPNDRIDEVIEIDSDDEDTSDVQPCSPYHKCHQSKTPPCILRKIAKQAEKNFNDIVELTEREKIYTPNVIELMEKLDEKSLIIAQLEDDITNLNSLSKEKDIEMERLKSKTTEADNEIKNLTSIKEALEQTCKDYNTKLTDWEVSYETLKKKSKSREDELLSLLEEHNSKKKNKSIGKLPSSAIIDRELKNFMDLSRDISLVNSSIENSIIENEPRQNYCDLKAQMTLKGQTIVELEANLHAQKLKIESLENINDKFKEMVSSLNDKVVLLNNENSLLKSSVESLNDTITNQKSLIETANAEIESYCIRELQTKVAKKDIATKGISDDDLEAIVANEETFIANNENMKNVVQSLMHALDIRKEEIDKLKSALDKTNLESLKAELETKRREMVVLSNEIERLKSEATDNISITDSLLQEKKNLVIVEEQLANKLTNIQEEKSLLEKQINEHRDEIKNLKEDSRNLSLELNGKHEEILAVKKANDNKIRDMTQKINKLEGVLKNKDEIIKNLKKEQNEALEIFDKAKLGLTKVQNIIKLLTGDINEIPDFIDSLLVVFSSLGDNLTLLESVSKDIVKEKNDVLAKLEHTEMELKLLHTNINVLDVEIDKFCNEYSSIVLEQMHEEVIKRDELVDTNLCDKLMNKINNLLSKIKTTQIGLVQSIADKNVELNDFKIRYQNKSTDFENESQKNNTHLQTIHDLTTTRLLTSKTILEKVTNLTSKFGIENNISCQFDNDYDNLIEQVMLTIEKIDNYIALLKSEHSKFDNNENILEDARNKIQQLTEENLKLVQKIADLETNKANLTKEITKIEVDSTHLTKDLKNANDLLNNLRDKLNSKCSEFDIIEGRAKNWKDKFIDLEVLMHDKIRFLETENIELKSKCSDLEMIGVRKLDDEESLACGDRECYSRKQSNYIRINSPPSLLTICCNRIADAIDFNDEKSVTSSSSSTEYDESKLFTNTCQCKELLADVEKLVEEKHELEHLIEQLQNENENLTRERDEVGKEVQLLLEHSYELQKRILNHRTILSTLTATTYAENKSLSSQIKFLQHNHNRFHHVCQKDIPAFKRQLQDLMTILKTECLGKHNESFKRYSLPNALDTSSLHSTFKNESTFDNDLLMLDTNVTLTTCDNTMIAHNQTCFDVTQVSVSSEVACQTNFNEVTMSLYPQMDLQPLDENKIVETLKSLKNENDKLRELVDDFTKNKSKVLVTTLTSPIKIPDSTEDSCKKCDEYLTDIRICDESHKIEIEVLSKKLNDIECERNEISEKYRNLTLEIPSSDALVRKLTDLDKEYQNKINEIDKLTLTVNKANKKLIVLQEENDSLSNDIMEKIEEIDILKKEQNNLKEINIKITEENKDKHLETLKFENKTVCDNCALKEETINSLQKRILLTESHSKLDRSYSDADSSSRYNKICTLQNELHAGKEDCIELKEQVTTIKKHLEHSNLSMSQNMDLDESIIDTHMCSFNKDYGSTNENKFDTSKVFDGQVVDVYMCDKTDCLNYYCEKTGATIESLSSEYKIKDIMHKLYVDLSTKHSNDIENLVNKLKDLEEAKTNLQAQVNKIKEEQSNMIKDLKDKDGYIQGFVDVISHVRKNINVIKDEIEAENVVVTFRETVLNVVDTEFGLSSSNIFDAIINEIYEKCKKELEINTTEITQLKEHIHSMSIQSTSVSESLQELKSRLTEKESEYGLLERQKEKIIEISNAVTKDLIRREEELREQISHYYRKLLENKIIHEEIDVSIPVVQFLDKLFNIILNKEFEEQADVAFELENLKSSLHQKNIETKLLNEELKKTEEYKQKLETQILLHEDLNKIYIKKVEENETNGNTIVKLTETINLLKENVSNKEQSIASLQNKHKQDILEQQAKEIELVNNLQKHQKELQDLKSVNKIILNERQTCEKELESARKLLSQHNFEIAKMTLEIESLKRSMHESSRIIESLNLKSDTLLEENNLLKKQTQEKCANCERLETNIRTHEKTATIQTKIINRLQIQKAEGDKSNSEKEKQIEAMTMKCKSVEEECKQLTNAVQTSKEECEKLRCLKQTLELRIAELQSVEAKPRVSIEPLESTRRRRQSIQDSKRVFAEDVQDHTKLEAMFKSHSKPDEMFMDVSEDSSSRSTPIKLSRGHDSLLSKHEQSDTTEEHSRPSSVAASRRRRQSAYDMRRSVVRDERHDSHESSGSLDSEAAHYKRQLESCQQELSELRQRFKEVDEECDTCAAYLRDREQQCERLNKDKAALEKIIMELRNNMKTMVPNNGTNVKTTFIDAAVNTEEDWTNLHSVVVDRMSFDAQVEKNKKLTKTIEELRYKKQDLRNTLNKMQKALEKSAQKDKCQELESTKAELSKCKQELEELKEKYKELDDECETCAEYLRERDQQCLKLKEAKAALEAKLEEYQQSSMTQSVRRRRQTIHDQSRLTQRTDAATNTSDDLLSYQVERDNSKQREETSKQMTRLKMVVDKLSQEKSSLEQQLASAGTQYVATGSAIVQNQQLSDVMKENQKLKNMNAKLVTLCRKRGKSMADSNRENEDPTQQNNSK